jgi:hypothetical protein
VNEAAGVLERLAARDLSARVAGEYQAITPGSRPR